MSFFSFSVIPAQAGIQAARSAVNALDTGFRRCDA